MSFPANFFGSLASKTAFYRCQQVKPPPERVQSLLEMVEGYVTSLGLNLLSNKDVEFWRNPSQDCFKSRRPVGREFGLQGPPLFLKRGLALFYLLYYSNFICYAILISALGTSAKVASGLKAVMFLGCVVRIPQ